MLISIISAVIILGLLIVVHEAGHFMMAKRLGIRVLRFSIGYPPRIWGIRRGETEYVLGATPFGGYVRMLGDEVGEEPRAEELNTYLREIGFDLIGAARNSGAFQRKAEPPIEYPKDAGAPEPAAMSPVSAPAAPADESEARLQAIAHRLAGEGLDVGERSEAAEIVGRELRPEENILLGAIVRTGSAEKAREFLCENPPGVVVDAFRARAFPTQRLAKRVAVVLAGPLSNLLFAPILLTLVFMYGIPTLLPVIGKVEPAMPAATAGLKSGDRIAAINGEVTETWADFSNSIKALNGAPVHLEIERSSPGYSRRLNLVIQPKLVAATTPFGTSVKQWIIGVMPRGDETTTRFSPFMAAYKGVKTSVSMTRDLVSGIVSIVSGAIPMREALGGPIMIAQMAGREAHEGLANVAIFTVMLSLELGLINLLPVPLLDGGHLLFFAFEGVRGKPLDLRHRELALQVGLFLLVALMAFVIFNDISRIVQG
jgi:regulator of sigma E protease